MTDRPGRVGSYLSDVDAAETTADLDELVDEFRGEQLRHRAPAAIEAPGQDDDGQEVDDGGTYIYDEAGRLVPAEWTEDGRLVPARPQTTGTARPADGHASPGQQPVTWAGALAHLGWRLDPSAEGCEITGGGSPCGAAVTRHISGGWVCGRHYDRLAAVIITGSRA